MLRMPVWVWHNVKDVGSFLSIFLGWLLRAACVFFLFFGVCWWQLRFCMWVVVLVFFNLRVCSWSELLKLLTARHLLSSFTSWRWKEISKPLRVVFADSLVVCVNSGCYSSHWNPFLLECLLWLECLQTAGDIKKDLEVLFMMPQPIAPHTFSAC